MSIKDSGMPYIADKRLFKAVMFARQMYRNGDPPALAAYKAGKYYGVRSSDIGFCMGKVGGRKAARLAALKGGK